MKECKRKIFNGTVYVEKKLADHLEQEIERLKAERVELVKFTLKHFLSDPYCLGYWPSEIAECIEQFDKEK